MQITLFGKDLDIRRRRSGLIHRSPVNVGAGERLISALAGAGLMLYGLRRRSLAGVLMALAGGSFLFRGVTGHCELNEAIGRSSAGMSE
jgi:uncharacterized membrane protein